MKDFKIIWFTGLPASGKTTLASSLEPLLKSIGLNTHLLDGDAFRKTFSSDLTYSDKDRSRNIARVSDLLTHFSGVNTQLTCICAFVSPMQADRELLRTKFKQSYFEVWCRCPVNVCANRDPKGMYKTALAGHIPNFTGVSSPYEEPTSSDIVVDTDKLTVDECLDRIVQAFFKT